LKLNLTMIHQSKNDWLCNIFIIGAHMDKTKW
jgi:hypothetical protein